MMLVFLQEEETEDISIMAGVAPNEESYFGTTVYEHEESSSVVIVLNAIGDGDA